MSRKNDYPRLVELFRQAVRAHNDECGDDDPEWPLWYAGHLHEKLNPHFCPHITRSRLVYCLVAAEDERQARTPESDRAGFYARHFLEHFASSEDPESDALALYYFPTCPFCRRVLRVIDEFGIKVDLRNIRANETHFDELIEARGRGTVPVLRVTSVDGDDRWMPESADIVAYLTEVFGQRAA